MKKPIKILAIGASNNRKSINRELATFAAGLAPDAIVETIDINDYELPIFSDEREQKLGKPELAQAFYQLIGRSDALVVSFAEHNGSYTAAYKNLFDWVSRIDMKVFQNKPAVFLSTSPGPGGARSVLKSATESAEFFGADLVTSISIPSFYDNFDSESAELTNELLLKQLSDAMHSLAFKASENALPKTANVMQNL